VIVRKRSWGQLFLMAAWPARAEEARARILAAVKVVKCMIVVLIGRRVYVGWFDFWSL
jgi:hypothetical protein